MDADLLKRVMNLAERTGDRVIVVNPESGTATSACVRSSHRRSKV
jgi:hypothetical protein